MASLPRLDGASVPASDEAALAAMSPLAAREPSIRESEDRESANRESANREDDEQFLLRAFRSFAEAAGSLERSYALLRAEVERLRGELAQSNAGLERSLEENRRMRQHLDRILEGLPCGVLVVSETGQISRANPEARRLLGLDSASAGASLDVLPEELRQVLGRAQSAAVEQEQCVAGGREQPARWLAVRHAAVEDSAPPSSIFILRDVSAAKSLEQERDRQQRERALAEMSAMLAHEIRNPVASLELFAGLLAGSELPGPCPQWVEQVQAGLRTLAATVNNVLQFHSLPAPERTASDLGDLLDWAASFLGPVARQARVELWLDNRLRGVRVAADRHRLEQVLLNLVLNAVRAMPGGGCVEISGNTVGGELAAICIADSGPGVAPEHAAKIFEPGFSTRAGSPGLGLTVCRKIVEQHGGVIEVARRAGAGASFTLRLPLRAA